MARRHPTGIDALDRQLGGGLDSGRIVCLRTAPGSQGERLLRELALADRTLYLSTTRTDDAVAEWLSADDHDVEVEYAGVDGLTPRGGDAVRQWVRDASGWTDAEPSGAGDAVTQLDALSVAVRSWDGAVVIDPVNPIETSPEPVYLSFLQEVQRRLQATESLGFLHVVETADDPPDRWLTLQVADEVWDVTVDVTNMRVDFVLTITKSRSNDLPGEQIKLLLGEDVGIDTSRDIS